MSLLRHLIVSKEAPCWAPKETSDLTVGIVLPNFDPHLNPNTLFVNCSIIPTSIDKSDECARDEAKTNIK